MALVMNALPHEVTVQVHGFYFTFKPKQIKQMDDTKVEHLSQRCAHLGFVAVPSEFEDPDYRSTDAGKAKLKEMEETGLKHRIHYLEVLQHNELVSLKADMQKSNDQSDPRLQMSPQMIKQLQELAGYKQAAKKAGAEQVAQIEKLLKDIEG